MRHIVPNQLEADTTWLPVSGEQSKATHRAANSLSIALVHDWCPSFRGGERVLAELCSTFGAQDVFTLLDFLGADVKAKHFPDVAFHTSPLSAMPFAKQFYRGLFFACPFVMEQFDVTAYDAVVSSSAAFARGVLTRPDQPHLCYVHSPARYAWDEQFSYIAQSRLCRGPTGLLYRYFLHRLRTWDTRTASSPDLMVANSRFVRARIRRIYGRDAEVVHPPVDTAEFAFTREKDDYYVTASFLAPYKRVDVVVDAFRGMPSKRLLVVGDGQQKKSLRALAGPNVTFTGFLPREDFIATVSQAKAFVFAGCEDFGIAIAEAQACGTPVVALGRGGACDIVRPLGETQPTGVFFSEQTPAAVVDAVERFERNQSAIRAEACRLNAERFSPEHFRYGMSRALDTALWINAKNLR
jgi:glycosyltransferase involved in cell wall biosynthesis